MKNSRSTDAARTQRPYHDTCRQSLSRRLEKAFSMVSCLVVSVRFVYNDERRYGKAYGAVFD